MSELLSTKHVHLYWHGLKGSRQKRQFKVRANKRVVSGHLRLRCVEAIVWLK